MIGRAQQRPLSVDLIAIETEGLAGLGPATRSTEVVGGSEDDLVSFNVPSLLVDRAQSWGGSDGERWLAALPSLAASLARRWRLELSAPLPSHVSFIAPARRDGEPVMLKIPMHGVDLPYAQANNRTFEPAALRHWQGEVSIELIDLDDTSGAMLLEACEPGTRLADQATLEETDEIGCDLLERLWRPAPDQQLASTADLAQEWARRAVAFYDRSGEPFEPGLLDRALALLEGLAASNPPATLLHGDFHPNNILASQRRPWLVIDPLPLVGEREYDAVMFLLFRKGNMAKPEHDWDAVITSICARLCLDSRRVKEWLFVRLVCDALAYLSHGGTAHELDARQEDLWSARLVHNLLV